MTSIEPTVLSSKRVVYVGGLAEEATVPIVRAFFVPFGNIKSVDIPMDYKEGKNKGFCFVEFEDADDAAEAIFNSDGSEVLGKTIKCNLAQANQVHQISSYVLLLYMRINATVLQTFAHTYAQKQGGRVEPRRMVRKVRGGPRSGSRTQTRTASC